MKRCEVTCKLMNIDFLRLHQYTYGCWMRSMRVLAD